MEELHCMHCDTHETRLRDVEQAVKFALAALRFVAVASPIALGVASFIVLVTK